MSLLNNTSGYVTNPSLVRGSIEWSRAWLSGLIKRVVARALAYQEYRANLAVLRSFSDRELMDIGIHRGQIGIGLSEAAKTRTAQQKFLMP